MTEEEREILSRLSSKNQQFFIPLAWATNLVRHARSQNRIKEDYAQKTLIDVCFRFIHNILIFAYLKYIV